jgi:hypothetical protein
MLARARREPLCVCCLVLVDPISPRCEVTRGLTSPLLRALSPCHGPAVPFCPRVATDFQFTSSTASSPSLPADRPHCALSLAPLCSNWSFSAPPGLKAELGHASWQPTPFPLNSRLIAQLASPPPPPHPAHLAVAHWPPSCR